MVLTFKIFKPNVKIGKVVIYIINSTHHTYSIILCSTEALKKEQEICNNYLLLLDVYATLSPIAET